MPKVSVIIPVYNVEQYLKECLDSVVNQTLKDIEIICVNDGSTDNSLSILKEYAEKDNRIKLIDLKKNVGLGKARNVAFREVTSDYVMYLDSDDWYELDACEEAYNQIVKYNNDLVIFMFSNCFETNKKIVKNLYKLKNLDNCTNIKYKDLDKPYSFVASWYKIYSVKFLRVHNICFEEGCYYEDIQFFYQLIFANPDFSLLFKSLYNHRIRDYSITNLKNSFYNELLVRNRLLKKCIDFGNEKYLKYFIISSINNVYHAYIKYSQSDILFRCRNYNKVRNIIINLDGVIKIDTLKEEVNKYSEILKIKKYSLTEYLIRSLLKNIFSISNSKDKKHKIIKIMGIKIKFIRHCKNKYFVE